MPCSCSNSGEAAGSNRKPSHSLAIIVGHSCIVPVGDILCSTLKLLSSAQHVTHEQDAFGKQSAEQQVCDILHKLTSYRWAYT